MQDFVRYAIGVAKPVTGTRTVLVISDDQAWRSMVRQVLESDGYGVLSARHAGQALVTCVRHDGPVDLVIAETSAEHNTGLAGLAREKPGAKHLVVDPRTVTRQGLLEAVRSALH
jgi:DNA-binding NtrC family response regulator